MSKSITLTRGKVALVDDADYEWLNQWKWYFHGEYAARYSSGFGRVYMHREIMKTPAGKFTDHINGNKLDNRRENLRVCTQAENNRNVKRLSTNKSGYRGVCWDKHRDKWSVEINVSGEKLHLGRFDNLDDAIRTYNEAAIRYHGEFARLNND